MNLSTRYLEELENTDHDQALRQHLANAVEVAGEETGVPLIIFETEDQQRVAYFGPVIARMPSPERGLELWDSIECIATGADFFELKRRRASRSKVKTTKRLFPELS